VKTADTPPDGPVGPSPPSVCVCVCEWWRVSDASRESRSELSPVPRNVQPAGFSSGSCINWEYSRAQQSIVEGGRVREKKRGKGKEVIGKGEY
jgi:hypothetical protein